MFDRRLVVALLFSALATSGSWILAAEPLRIRVLSYNIHHGEGTDMKFDLPRVANVIKEAKPDVVALQEVDVRTRRSGRIDQATELGKLTGMASAFGRAVGFQGGEYGLAVLSRWPIAKSQTTTLPESSFEQRIVLRAELEIPDRESLLFFATHFDHREGDAERLASAERIERLVASVSGQPALLVGDLNDLRGSATLEKLQKTWTIAGEGEAPTIPVEAPTRQIDFVLFRPAERWKTIEVRVLDEAVA